MSAEYAQAIEPSHDGTVMRVSRQEACPCGASLATLPPRTRFCRECCAARRVEQHRRYDRTFKGRARTRRYVSSPKKKLAEAAWVGAHPDRVAVHRARWNRTRRRATLRTCETDGCTAIVLLNGRNNATKFCDPCRAFYGLVAA